MRVGIAFALVLIACQQTTGDDYPIGPGGGPGGITPGQIDAADDGAGTGDGGVVNGRVCLVTDLRNLTSCANSGAGGLTVQLGSQTTSTADDGKFAIVAPAATMLVWSVSGGTIVPSLMGFGANATIPAVDATRYGDLLIANGVLLSPGQGSIVVRALQAGAPAVGALVTASPVPQYATYYDGIDMNAWDQDATGAFGVAWLTGVAVGTPTVRISPAVGSAAMIPLGVADQAITYATVELP
jgi:hypothetical protein